MPPISQMTSSFTPQNYNLVFDAADMLIMIHKLAWCPGEDPRRGFYIHRYPSQMDHLLLDNYDEMSMKKQYRVLAKSGSQALITVIPLGDLCFV